MAEDLGELFENLSNEEPSDHFVTETRRQLLDEADRVEVLSTPERLFDLHTISSESIPAVDIAFQTSDDATTSTPVAIVARGFAVAVAAAVVLFAAAWFGNESSDTSTLETLTQPDTESTTGGPSTTIPVASGAASALVPGRYRVESLGTEFQFEVTETTAVLQNSPSVFQLGELSDDGRTGRTISFLRISGFVHPDSLFQPIEAGDAQWPADDVFGWIEKISEELPVQIVGTTNLDGVTATRFVVFGLAEQCHSDETCAFLATNNFETSVGVAGDGVFGVWYVDQGDEDPFVMVLETNVDDHVSWFTRADRILESVQFSETEPNPVGSTSDR